jgi:glycosyltransferase involved in cell wall biosynthesis
MTTSPNPHLLFAVYMAGGNATIQQNLHKAIAPRADVESSWLPVELEASDKVYGRHKTRRRPLLPGTLRNSGVTGERIRELEGARRPFDAAYFFGHTICMFLFRFRRRVPYVLAMDGTPLWYARHRLWYAFPRFDPQSVVSRIKHAVVRSVYRGAHHLFPLSHGVRDSLVHEYGIAPEKITVMPPGVNLQHFPCPDRRLEERERRPLRVLFVGADYERKGGPLVVQLAGTPEFADVHFDVVTRSFRGTAPANVTVHANVQTNTEQMVELFRNADVFMLPTDADAHSVAAIEASAMGLPVISTAVGGIVDIVDEGKTGFLVDPRDATALADRLRRLRDRELRLRLGEAARRRAEALFDNEKIAAAVVETMKRAAARSQRVIRALLLTLGLPENAELLGACLWG